MRDAGLRLLQLLAEQLRTVVSYPADPGRRLFVLYLLSALLLAIIVYLANSTDRKKRFKAWKFLAGFLFPKRVWTQASAWLDVRYFFFHQIFRLFIYGGYLAGVAAVTHTVVSTAFGSVVGPSPLYRFETSWPIELLWVLTTVVAVDLLAYRIHYYQHKLPLLWEFHKVHHSASVMHPLTNYREHPVDNLAYAVGTGATLGLFSGMADGLLGYVPSEPEFLGVGISVFAFNLLGYNLRHSHIWLRWPGRLGMVFGCPAHHQIHHSCHPEHWDKNFAFMFPIWDVLFGTFCLPETSEGIQFGLGGGEESDYRSCLGLYFLPVKKCVERVRLLVEDSNRRVEVGR